MTDADPEKAMKLMQAIEAEIALSRCSKTDEIIALSATIAERIASAPDPEKLWEWFKFNIMTYPTLVNVLKWPKAGKGQEQ